jgi:hypothetical protein
MGLTAIVALNLAALPMLPGRLFDVPLSLFLIVSLELALVQVAFGRPLRTFYFTFLGVGFVVSILATVSLVAPSGRPIPSLGILQAGFELYKAVRGQGQITPRSVDIQGLAEADRVVTGILSMLPAFAVAVVASRLTGRSSISIPEEIVGRAESTDPSHFDAGAGRTHRPLRLAGFYAPRRP